MYVMILLSVRIGVIVVMGASNAEARLIGLTTLHGDPVTVEGTRPVLDGLATNAGVFLDVHVRIINGNVTK